MIIFVPMTIVYFNISDHDGFGHDILSTLRRIDLGFPYIMRIPTLSQESRCVIPIPPFNTDLLLLFTKILLLL